MRIILLGPPGSGKSVISRKIAEKYGFPVVSVEEVAEELSAMAQQNDELGRLAKESIGSGRVSDDVCNTVLKRVLGKEELAPGFVLVGYPKDAAQAEYIETAMNQIRRPLDLVLMIDIDRDELMERRVGRIDCDACGTHYNLYVNPPMVEGICDLCGSRVSRRPRGYEENIANQLREYDVAVQPVLGFFKQLGKLRRVDANGTEEQLWEEAQATIDAAEPASLESLPEEQPVSKESAAKSKPVAKKVAKKAASKKTAAKKVQDKSPPSKKAAAKKKPAGKRKAAVKKATAASKKKAVKKVPAKKPASAGKKKAAKKAATKKTATRKKIAKKKVIKKAAAKKTARKIPVKTLAKKKAVKKSAAAAVKRKSSSKKTAKKTSKKKVSKKQPLKKKVIGKKAAKKKTTRNKR